MVLSRCEDPASCKTCGGKCCKKSGCYFHPQDFSKIDLETLQSAIDSGKISIAGDIIFKPNFSFDVFLSVKARNKNQREIELFTTPGECISLTETGCEYSLEKRPTGGAVLIPKLVDGKPDCGYGVIDEEHIILAWAPY